MRNNDIIFFIFFEPLDKADKGLEKFRKNGKESFRQDCWIISQNDFYLAMRSVSSWKHRELLAACQFARVEPNPIRLISLLINANVIAENVVAYQELLFNFSSVNFASSSTRVLLSRLPIQFADINCRGMARNSRRSFFLETKDRSR